MAHCFSLIQFITFKTERKQTQEAGSGLPVVRAQDDIWYQWSGLGIRRLKVLPPLVLPLVRLQPGLSTLSLSFLMCIMKSLEEWNVSVIPRPAFFSGSWAFWGRDCWRETRIEKSRNLALIICPELFFFIYHILSCTWGFIRKKMIPLLFNTKKQVNN